MIAFSDHPMVRLRTEEEITKSLFEKEERLDHFPSIPDFYADQDIFITGGSGFIGKVLLEKLLRSCPGIGTIYVLLRSKKGKSVEDRLKAIAELPLFGPLKSAFPESIKKLVPINGDITELKLGLSEIDIEKMKNVSIIFHSAASVRFDDSLKKAIIMNTRGTREVMKFAENLRNIKVVMHVSTTYSNPDQNVVEEKIYPEYVSWEKAIEISEKVDEDQLDMVTQHYTNFMPNTYVFSKNLAEHVSGDYSAKLPVVIYRPSIVISSLKEPLAGWVDNFNGPVGLLCGSALGIVRTMYSNPDNRCDFLPVDLCVKGMIIAAWKRGNESNNLIPVYNCASYNMATARLQQIVDIGRCLTESIPFDKTILKPGGHITNNRYSNYLKVIFYQLFPALVIDAILKVKGHKTLMTKIQRKIYEANMALTYFTMNEWIFENDNFLRLHDCIKLTDLRAFGFRDCFDHDAISFIRICMYGVKKYLLLDDEKNLKRNLLRDRFLKVIHQFLCSIPYMLVFYILVKNDFFGCLNFLK